MSTPAAPAPEKSVVPAEDSASSTSSSPPVIPETKEAKAPFVLSGKRPLDENGIPILEQAQLEPNTPIEYVEVTIPPMYETDKAKGDLQMKIPKVYLQYKPKLAYVGSADVIYCNFQDTQFYEGVAQLPHPILRIWLLINHKGFDKVEGSYVKRRLLEEAYRDNIQITCVNPDKCDLQVSKHGFDGIVYEGKQLPLPDCVISRVGASVGYFGLAVLRQLESLGLYVFNNVQSIEVSRDKLYTHQILAGNGVPIPKTVLGKFPVEYDFIEKHFGYPVIMKRTSGSKGDQVWKLDSKEELMRLEAKLEDKDKPYLFQEYLASTKGRDIRAFVIGERVSASMMRVAAKGQFKANVHQGGTVKSTKLKKPLEAMVLKTARLCGLEFAGVDVLLDKDGYKICEVNSSPGFEGLERATHVNVARDIINYVKDKMEKMHKARKQIEEESVPLQEDHVRLGTEIMESLQQQQREFEQQQSQQQQQQQQQQQHQQQQAPSSTSQPAVTVSLAPFGATTTFSATPAPQPPSKQ